MYAAFSNVFRSTSNIFNQFWHDQRVLWIAFHSRKLIWWSSLHCSITKVLLVKGNVSFHFPDYRKTYWRISSSLRSIFPPNLLHYYCLWSNNLHRTLKSLTLNHYFTDALQWPKEQILLFLKRSSVKSILPLETFS